MSSDLIRTYEPNRSAHFFVVWHREFTDRRWKIYDFINTKKKAIEAHAMLVSAGEAARITQHSVIAPGLQTEGFRARYQ